MSRLRKESQPTNKDRDCLPFMLRQQKSGLCSLPLSARGLLHAQPPAQELHTLVRPGRGDLGFRSSTTRSPHAEVGVESAYTCKAKPVEQSLRAAHGKQLVLPVPCRASNCRVSRLKISGRRASNCRASRGRVPRDKASRRRVSRHWFSRRRASRHRASRQRPLCAEFR